MKTVTQTNPIFRVENISKILGGNKIIDRVSIELNKGDLKVLIGPSGGGKSTLLQCMNLLYLPDEGDIYLEGQKVIPSKKSTLFGFRQQVGMIFQDFNLFDHLSALENVAIALIKVKKQTKAKARERAMQELERVGLGDKADLYPAQLSGGQKQRVSVARALAMDPKIMLLDEPTSALDPELIGEVLAVIRDLAASGMTMVMATHQIGFAASLADEFVFMQDGRIVEQGAPQELMDCTPVSRTKNFCSKLAELYGEEA
jgi:polar amino acid transport system ATP-binding protein